MLPTLADVLEYKNPRVIERFSRNFPEHASLVDELFADMLRYLWLTKQHDAKKKAHPEDKSLMFNCVMQQEMIVMDEIWHVFILFTKDYTEFCQCYFGEYLHHVPYFVQDHPQTDEEFLIDFEKFLSFAIDHLGAATISRWFH